MVPSISPPEPLTDRAVTERVLRLLEMVGLDPEPAGSLVVTPTCGLAGRRTEAEMCRGAATC